jgi:hypothetical protein
MTDTTTGQGSKGVIGTAADIGHRRWTRALAEHDRAVENLLATAAALDEAAWARPVRPGGWAPAQIAEHVAMTLEALARDLAGGTPMHIRVGRGWQTLLRWVVLPHVLFHRSLPLRARAPREARPAVQPRDRDAVLTQLRAAWAVLAAEAARAADRPRARVTHPYFGRIDALRGLRFSAIHVEHHRRQLAD